MDLRTVGVEEELLLVDPATRSAVPRSPEVVKHLHEHLHTHLHQHGVDDDLLDQELFRHQLETKSEPHVSLEDVGADLAAARSLAARAAGDVGLVVVASGMAPVSVDPPRVTRNDRYLAMTDAFGELALVGGTCGMHVHVAIDSDEEGVAVLDRIAPWLPVLLAVSANSPIAAGRDTSYASWRAREWARWPSAGPTEAFGDVETYRRVSQALVESGAARDPGMLYFDARLAADYPTVEVRVADVCTDPQDALLVAALARGLVHTAASDWRDGRPRLPWRAEVLRAAHWRAARYGLAGRLVHPATGLLAPAAEVLDELVELVAASVGQHGDDERVRSGVERVRRGGGATQQRQALERTGSILGVVDDLVLRTSDGPQAPG